MLTRSYCPGVVTSVVLYVPTAVVVAAAALRDRLLGPGALAATLVLAVGVHVAEVGHNVSKRW